LSSKSGASRILDCKLLISLWLSRRAPDAISQLEVTESGGLVNFGPPVTDPGRRGRPLVALLLLQLLQV
jgi:hypothetical protein